LPRIGGLISIGANALLLEARSIKALKLREIMDSIGSNLQAVRQRIAISASACGRNSCEIGLIAVSKTFGADAVAEAYASGQRAFGENYVQEALTKIATLAGLPIDWHFIGPVQSNKTRAIAENFAWVHTIDRLKVAERLCNARPATLPPLQVCIQVNIGDENSKSGVEPSHALELARRATTFPRLQLRGLMTVPPRARDVAVQRRYFAQLRQLRDEIAAAGIALDTLSMGMSDDLEAAIAEGTTLVRIGTAIFGQRQQRGASARQP
jgi:pyridoxal phosphate enzyme (YggS family)